MAEQKRTVPRLALSIDEAAETLSVSRDFFDQHIRHELRVTTSAWQRSIAAHLRLAPTLGGAMGLRPALEANDGVLHTRDQPLALLGL